MNYFKERKAIIMSKKEIVIGTSALLLTFRCNLRCKLCCTMTPLMPQEKQVDFPLEELKAVVKRYFEVTKYIRKFSFGGGEPTLYRQLPELIEYTIGFKDQFEVLEIITNGAAIPSKEVLEMAEKYRDIVFFMIDDYGYKVSQNAAVLSKMFMERGIRNKVRCYHGEAAHAGGWVDLGDYLHKHNREQSTTLLKSCCISGKKKNSTGVRQDEEYDSRIEESNFFITYAANTNGLVHRCARAYSTLQAGSISNTSDCFVNIMDETKSVDQIRQEIISMFSSDHYHACEFCNGFDDTSKRYPPAEQIVR